MNYTGGKERKEREKEQKNEKGDEKEKKKKKKEKKEKTTIILINKTAKFPWESAFTGIEVLSSPLFLFIIFILLLVHNVPTQHRGDVRSAYQRRHCKGSNAIL